MHLLPNATGCALRRRTGETSMRFVLLSRFGQFLTAAALAAGLSLPAVAQQLAQGQPESVAEVVVTGSRILQNAAQASQPLSIISSDQIEKTGLASVGDLLQQ